MRKPTTVTTSSITEDSGSTSAATLAWKSPTPIHSYSVTVVRSEPLRTSRNTPIATSAARPTATDATTPVQRCSHRRPKKPLMRNAARGSAGISQTFWINPLSLHLSKLIDVDGRPVAIGGQNDGEPDGDLGRGDDEDEDDEDAAALVDRRESARERDEREVRRIQHQLDRHQDHDRVAPDEHTGSADEEQGRRDRDECAERNGHWSSRFTSTIAPTMAARRSTDATSKGKAKSRKTLVARGTRSPPFVPAAAESWKPSDATSATTTAIGTTSSAAHHFCVWKNSP